MRQIMWTTTPNFAVNAKMRLKSRLGLAAAGHGAPHALGGGGHVDIGDAERRQSIHHSVHDRGRRADGAGLATAFSESSRKGCSTARQ